MVRLKLRSSPKRFVHTVAGIELEDEEDAAASAGLMTCGMVARGSKDALDEDLTACGTAANSVGLTSEEPTRRVGRNEVIRGPLPANFGFGGTASMSGLI